MPEDVFQSAFKVDVLNPDYKMYPSLQDLQVHDAEVQTGQLIFIPQGRVHQVENIGDTLAISFNFVDRYSLSDYRDFLRRKLKRAFKDEDWDIALPTAHRLQALDPTRPSFTWAPKPVKEATWEDWVTRQVFHHPGNANTSRLTDDDWGDGFGTYISDAVYGKGDDVLGESGGDSVELLREVREEYIKIKMEEHMADGKLENGSEEIDSADLGDPDDLGSASGATADL